MCGHLGEWCGKLDEVVWCCIVGVGIGRLLGNWVNSSSTHMGDPKSCLSTVSGNYLKKDKIMNTPNL